MANEITYKPGTFARFFKAVKGRQVTRFGTARYGTKAKPAWREGGTIGGQRPPMKETDHREAKIRPLSHRPCNPIELNLEMVTAITETEARLYNREYNRAVAGGDLLEVSELDYIAWLKLDAKRAKAAIARAKKNKEDRKAAVANEKANKAKEAAERAKAAQEARTSATTDAAGDKGKGKRSARKSGASDGPEVPKKE